MHLIKLYINYELNHKKIANVTFYSFNTISLNIGPKIGNTQ